MSEILDLVGDGQLRFLVEIAGQGDDDEGGSAVRGAERIDPRRPGIGDVEYAFHPGDRVHVGRDGLLDRGVVEVDAVGHDRELTARGIQVVELLGDPAGLGGGPSAEVGREDREGRAADRRGDDQDQDPGEDDGAPTAHHEAGQPVHDATAAPVVATVDREDGAQVA